MKEYRQTQLGPFPLTLWHRVGHTLLSASLLVLVGCSRQQDPEPDPAERPDAPVTEAHPTSQYVEKIEPPEPEKVEMAPCPFAAEIKQVVLRDVIQRLDGEFAAPDSLYFFQDPDDGRQVVDALGDVGPTVVGTVVPMVLQAGIPVERDTGRPIVLCAVEIEAWSEDQVDAVGIWLVDDETQGNDPYRLVRDGIEWVVSGENDE